MREQRGHTLIELVVVMAILVFVSGLATLAGVRIIGSARVSSAAARVVDDISFAREFGIARYERQRVRFLPNPVPASEVVRSFVVESCAVPTPYAAVCSTELEWSTVREFTAEPGTGLKVPLTGGLPTNLLFDRTGRFLNTEDALIEVCSIVVDTDGSEICRSGSPTRLIKIRQFSGIVES